MEIELKDVMEYLEKNSEEQDVVDYLSKYSTAKEFTLDDIKHAAEENKDVKSWIDSIKDTHSSKALETWKANNLQKVIDDEIVNRLPKDEQRDLEIKAMQDQIESMRREKDIEVQRNIALHTAQTKGMPTSIIDFFLGEDEETTLANLSLLEDAYSKSLEEQVRVRMKDHSYTPPKGSSQRKFTTEDFETMTPQQINDFFESK